MSRGRSSWYVQALLVLVVLLPIVSISVGGPFLCFVVLFALWVVWINWIIPWRKAGDTAAIRKLSEGYPPPAGPECGATVEPA